jgi:hypothetical protein
MRYRLHVGWDAGDFGEFALAENGFCQWHTASRLKPARAVVYPLHHHLKVVASNGEIPWRVSLQHHLKIVARNGEITWRVSIAAPPEDGGTQLLSLLGVAQAVARGIELVMHFFQAQSQCGCCRAGLAAVFCCEGFGYPIRRAEAAAYVYQGAGYCADHLIEETAAFDFDFHAAFDVWVFEYFDAL